MNTKNNPTNLLSNQTQNHSNQYKNKPSTTLSEARKAFIQIVNGFKEKQINLNYDQIKQVYNIQPFEIEEITPPSAITLYQQAYQECLSPKTFRNWNENELRILIWLIFQYPLVKQTNIQKLIDEDWWKIAHAFLGKNIQDVKFEWFLLFKFTSQVAVWTKKEDQLLKKLMSQTQFCGRWIQISKIMYVNSQKDMFKNPKQCRERWVNYLNPTIEKGEWSLRQDKLLLEQVMRIGKKWSSISRALCKRTDHSVKNRYYCLLKKYIRENSIRIRSKTTKGMRSKQLQQIQQIYDNILSQLQGNLNQTIPFQKQQQYQLTKPQQIKLQDHSVSSNSLRNTCIQNPPQELSITKNQSSFQEIRPLVFIPFPYSAYFNPYFIYEYR